MTFSSGLVYFAAHFGKTFPAIHQPKLGWVRMILTIYPELEKKVILFLVISDRARSRYVNYDGK